MTEKLLTQQELAERWGVSIRTIVRRRQEGAIKWLNLTKGLSKRRMVRFRMEDIIEFENKKEGEAK